MMTSSIKNVNLFKIKDETTQNTYYGCDQEWYRTKWQRLSGCGPTAVTNIFHYYNRTHATIGLEDSIPTKIDCQLLMEDIWKYVTPTLKGISSTKLLNNGLLAYAKAKALNMKLEYIDIPKNRSLRPEFHSLLLFIDQALHNDSPVAFLNLNNGTEIQLDSWHWVTIISLEYTEDGNTAFTDVLDAGNIIRIDLARWFHTTTLGGGFVRVNLL